MFLILNLITNCNSSIKGQGLIKNICEKVPAYEELFNSRVRHYIIKEHILNVFNINNFLY